MNDLPIPNAVYIGPDSFGQYLRTEGDCFVLRKLDHTEFRVRAQDWWAWTLLNLPYDRQINK